jgi:DNA polymerase-3 subunit epsilon
MVREIILDTETTGLSAENGDRLVEIGCVELIDHIVTGLTFHRYINPERSVSEGARRVHGLSDAFLSDQLTFSACCLDLCDFLQDDILVIHNATFDIGFLNMEFGRLGHPSIAPHRVIDTLALARAKHPGLPNNLDALCARYKIDKTMRSDRHGALIDATLLASVYIELIGGKQSSLALTPSDLEKVDKDSLLLDSSMYKAPQRPFPLPSRLTAEERSRHESFLKTLKASCLWADYTPSLKN